MKSSFQNKYTTYILEVKSCSLVTYNKIRPSKLKKQVSNT